MLVFKPREAGSRIKYANHLAMVAYNPSYIKFSCAKVVDKIRPTLKFSEKKCWWSDPNRGTKFTSDNNHRFSLKTSSSSKKVIWGFFFLLNLGLNSLGKGFTFCLSLVFSFCANSLKINFRPFSRHGFD